MSCSLIDLKKEAIDSAMDSFLGNSISFRRDADSVFMPLSYKFKTKEQLVSIALSNAKRVESKMAQKYGEKFSKNWTQIDQSLSDGIRVRFTVPNQLVSALKQIATTTSFSDEKVERDLYDLNYTPQVISYLYEDSSKKFSIEDYEQMVRKLTNDLITTKSNQEILEIIKCL
jgi:hypothetical protein